MENHPETLFRRFTSQQKSVIAKARSVCGGPKQLNATRQLAAFSCAGAIKVICPV